MSPGATIPTKSKFESYRGTYRKQPGLTTFFKAEHTFENWIKIIEGLRWVEILFFPHLFSIYVRPSKNLFLLAKFLSLNDRWCVLLGIQNCLLFCCGWCDSAHAQQAEAPDAWSCFRNVPTFEKYGIIWMQLKIDWVNK